MKRVEGENDRPSIISTCNGRIERARIAFLFEVYMHFVQFCQLIDLHIALLGDAITGMIFQANLKTVIYCCG
jgi:hypothetical protein